MRKDVKEKVPTMMPNKSGYTQKNGLPKHSIPASKNDAGLYCQC